MRIAVFGKLRAGKSAVCDFISENYNDFTILDFGDSLKECVAIAYPDSVDKGKNRELLIKFGQHLRELDSDIWVNALKHKLIQLKNSNVLVTGVRQRNEFEMLKGMGFKFIKVEADEETRIKRSIENGDKFNLDTLNHPTETQLEEFDFDYLIRNQKGFKELEIEIRNVMKDLEFMELLRDE